MELIPESLRQAHEDGEVVFFCGAGVSIPAGMPSFYGLVKKVLEDLAPDPSKAPLPWKALNDRKYDEALDILERHEQGGFGLEVRKRVSDILQFRTRKLEAHRTLARLADLDEPNGRLVTTNFDHLFDRAIASLQRREKSRYRKKVDVAPTIPPPKLRTWRSLVYLHGKLGHSPDNENLILTTADFGAAYLLDRWASRFVSELFRNFYVIFIGYSIEDPTMRYLVSALAAARANEEHYRQAYAFAPFGGEDEPTTPHEAKTNWQIKGVQALTYENSRNRHKELWQGLEDWAEDHRGGLVSRRRVAAYYGQRPPIGKYDEGIFKLAWALKDPGVSRTFADLEERPNPAWIPLLQESGLFSLPIGKGDNGAEIPTPLVSRILPDFYQLNAATFQMGRWISRCIDSQEALDWALSEGAVLHSELRWEIARQLNNKTLKDIPTGLSKIWRVLASNEYAHALSAMYQRPIRNYPKLDAEGVSAKREFLSRLRPIPVLTRKADFYREQGKFDPQLPSTYCSIEIRLIGVEGNHEIESFRKAAVDWEAALGSMADDITTLLHEAMDLQLAFGLASADEDITSVVQPSISAHEQNKHFNVWTQLIELARESFDVLVRDEPAAAERLARRWQHVNYPVFRRLALYAATGGADD